MKKMEMTRRVAMIQVLAEEFCNSCLPYPEKVVKDVHQILPVIANKRNDELITIIKVYYRCALKDIFEKSLNC